MAPNAAPAIEPSGPAMPLRLLMAPPAPLAALLVIWPTMLPTSPPTLLALPAIELATPPPPSGKDSGAPPAWLLSIELGTPPPPSGNDSGACPILVDLGL